MSAKNRFGASETITSRTGVWKNGFLMSAIGNVVLGLCLLASIFLNISSQNQPVIREYFATREDGRIMPLVPISRPFLSEGQVSNYAVEGVTRAMSINFSTWRQDLSDASEYFQRPGGWEGFLDAIQSNGFLEFIQNRRLVATTVANGASITNSGRNSEGAYYWVIEIPISITYESSSEISRENRLAEVVVTRLPTWDSSEGIGISRIRIIAAR